MTKKQQRKPIPQFENEAQEQEFWSTHDSTGYVDWSRVTPVTFGRLKPSTQTISIRLPEALLADLKRLANKRDVPYQPLLKIFLAERVAQELRSHSYSPVNLTRRHRWGLGRARGGVVRHCERLQPP